MKTAIELLAYMINHPEESFASLVDTYDALTTEDQLKIKSVFKAVENMNIVPASEGEQGLNRPKTALELMGYMVKNPSVAFEDLADVYDVLSEEEKFAFKAALSRIPAGASEELSYDYEIADLEVMERLKTPQGQERFSRLRQMLKNGNPAEKSTQGVSGDFGQNIVKKDNADFPVFADWDDRPAILVDSETAIALLEPDGDWVPVDWLDVFTTSSVVPTREEFEEIFSRSFGSLNIPNQYPKGGQGSHELMLSDLHADFPVFASWERRPAILVDSDTAIALLEPDGDWVPVDWLDVFTTASVVPTREEFEERFSRSFGPLNIPNQYLREGQVSHQPMLSDLSKTGNFFRTSLKSIFIIGSCILLLLAIIHYFSYWENWIPWPIMAAITLIRSVIGI